MANLLKRQEILDLIQLKSQEGLIQEAQELEEDIRFYVVGDKNQTSGIDRFKFWLKSQIATEKVQEFFEVMTYPLPTATLTEIILNDLSKVLESYNKNITSIRFKPEAGTNGKAFESEYQIAKIMSNEVYPTFRTAPNSLIVIEPSNGQGQRPDLYFVDISRIVHIEQSIDGVVDYVIWQNDDAGKRYTACDSTNFHFITREDNESLEQSTVTTTPHRMGITPARFIYPVFSDTKNRIEISSPLANQVGKLRWYLFFSLAKRVLDKSAPFPIYSHYATPCSWEEHGQRCENGVIKVVNLDQEGNETFTTRKCPACSNNKNKLIAGSRVEIKAPKTKEDVDLRNPVQVLSAEEVSITFAVKEEERLEQAIYYNTVGKSLVPLESFSASVDQIDVAQESRKNTLMKMKLVFEQTHNFIVNCFGRTIYGNRFIEADVDYGDNWFLRTTEQELKTYEALKSITAPSPMLLEQLKNIVRRQYSTSPDERDRQLLLLELEPFVTETVATVKEWYDIGLVQQDSLVLKVHFQKIINDLESGGFGNLGTYLNSSQGTIRQKRTAIVKALEQKVKSLSSTITIIKPAEENGTKSKTGSPQGQE